MFKIPGTCFFNNNKKSAAPEASRKAFKIQYNTISPISHPTPPHAGGRGGGDIGDIVLYCIVLYSIVVVLYCVPCPLSPCTLAQIFGVFLTLGFCVCPKCVKIVPNVSKCLQIDNHWHLFSISPPASRRASSAVSPVRSQTDAAIWLRNAAP